ELAHRCAGTVLEVLPRLSPKLGERRNGAVGADVTGDLPELLVRHVQAVVAAEAEEEVVARDAGDLLRLESDQLADAVVLVVAVDRRLDPADHVLLAERLPEVREGDDNSLTGAHERR